MKILIRLILAPFILIGLLILALLSTFLYQAFWDWRVEAMCERDGGRAIYETVFLPKKEFKLLLDRHGDIDLPRLEKASPRDNFADTYDSEVLHRGLLGLTIMRGKYQIVRLRDGKVLAQKISYSRSGGDFPFTTSNGSSFGCPDYVQGDWFKKIFMEVQ